MGVRPPGLFAHFLPLPHGFQFLQHSHHDKGRQRKGNDIGYRLACMALNRTYGKKAVPCDSPRFRSVEFADGKAVVSLDNAEYGFNRLVGIEGFELCGSNGVFHPADVTVDAQMRLVVSSKEVSEPAAVRYCFRNFQIGNLANSWGLPVIPFRTDDFQPRP